MTTEMLESGQKRRPKILLVLPAHIIGGAEIWTYNLIKSLNVFSPVLLTQAAISDTYAPLNIPLYWFDDYGCRNGCLYSARNMLAYARAIKQVAREEKPDIVFGVLHNGTLFITAAATLYRLKGLAVGSILGNISSYFKQMQKSPSLHERLVLGYCFRRLRGIVTPSSGVRKDLIDNFWAPPDRIKVLHNGFDLNAIRSKAAEPVSLHKDCPWVVTSCRLDLEKDFDTLLHAFQLIRQKQKARLVIVGDGPLRQDIIDKATRLDIVDDLTLPGFKHNPFPYVACADVFILSSFFEGFGNVIVEAMALGVPVVASKCPSGPEEIIQDGESGYLVSVGDAEAMAEKCVRLMEDREFAATIVKQGLVRSAEFAVNIKTREFEEYLDSLLRDN